MIFDQNGNVAQAVGPGQGVIDTAQVAQPALGPNNEIIANNQFEQWVAGLVLQQDNRALTTALNNLRSVIGQWDRGEAVAASLLQRGIDELAPQVAPTALGVQATFASLSRRDWWKLFIDLNQQRLPHAPLVFDYQVSPGYYHAMVAAFEAVLGGGQHAVPAPGQTAAQWYDQLHQDVVAGVLHLSNGNWLPVGNTLSGVNGGFTTFPMGHPLNPAAFAELRREGILELAGVPGNSVCRYFVDSQRIRTAYASTAVAGQVNALFAAYQAQPAVAAQAKAAIDQLAATYTTLANQAEASVTAVGALRDVADVALLARAGKAARKARALAQELPWVALRQRVAHIAKLIRALHVGHYYTDANGRLNTMLLLDRVLQSEGMPPVVMADTSVFGGSRTIEQLSQLIVEGLLRFQSIVPRQ